LRLDPFFCLCLCGNFRRDGARNVSTFCVCGDVRCRDVARNVSKNNVIF
jgi:hypothetical protein